MGSGVSSVRNSFRGRSKATIAVTAESSSPNDQNQNNNNNVPLGNTNFANQELVRDIPDNVVGTHSRVSQQDNVHVEHSQSDPEHAEPSPTDYHHLMDPSGGYNNAESANLDGNSPDPPYSARSDNSDGGGHQNAEMFTHTALSLGMDNEDLLFNLMYFNEANDGATLGSVLDGVQQETLALHSENNTPYKLAPASKNGIDGLCRRTYEANDPELKSNNNEECCECGICKDDIENGDAIVQIPACQHFFHEECLLRWINLQGWCPVCRAPIDVDATAASSGASKTDRMPLIDEDDRQDGLATNCDDIPRDDYIRGTPQATLASSNADALTKSEMSMQLHQPSHSVTVGMAPFNSDEPGDHDMGNIVRALEFGDVNREE